MVIVAGALLGFVALLARRSLWRVVTRATLALLVLMLGVGVALLVAGPRWPWILVSVVVLVTAFLTWKIVRWARAVHAVAIARLVWFGWHWVMDVRDSRAWARASRPLSPPAQ